MKQEVILTTFEMIHTHGFVWIMFLMWGTAFILGAPVVFFLEKTRYKGRRFRK